MTISPGVIAFTVILVLYMTVGVLAAIGTAYVSKALLPPKFEQVFYAVYLAMIAGFYLRSPCISEVSRPGGLNRLQSSALP